MNTYMTEGVGKRIVDALKKQSEVELVSQTAAPAVEEIAAVDEQPSAVSEQPQAEQPYIVSPQPAPMFVQPQPAMTYTPNFADFSGLEVPPNVAVLKQLISQLPSGVSRQAGALVIKQTMEALGISMKSVLSEAQQLQENINSSARDCQNSILECKKQINTLEAQVQSYQKQSAALNDIVSLFLQIN